MYLVRFFLRHLTEGYMIFAKRTQSLPNARFPKPTWDDAIVSVM
jgi:hypothetical protein